ncbi:MAG TPA: conjugal transfer protein TraN [Sphingobium sp.]|uniref:conjugal transfer protein TraN n=1 Tax=Sphingobium sp. TaxID=1912891 RepID=UPI002ED1BDA7
MMRGVVPPRLVALTLAGLAAFWSAGPAGAQVEQLCAVDLNGNGDAADTGETASCTATQEGNWLCPLQATRCTVGETGDYACPLGNQYACQTTVEGEAPLCSPNACTAVEGGGVTDTPVTDDPGVTPDGAVDEAGNCLDHIQIFSGRALRCRTAGLKTAFSNCCRDRGKIVKDGTGSSLTSLSTKITVAKGVFSGMSAAFSAFKAGQTAGQAASAGAKAFIGGIDPTSIAISLAINFMIEFLLSGCDQQDMEVGMLEGSGMCHWVGGYCSSKILGICVQRSQGHCCFNTKLGRIIQEQGRPQLKSFNSIGWGSPEQPYCRGFTPEEFQALDFSRMDLSEYYSELEARAQADIQINMKDKIDGYMQSVSP